MTARRLSDRGFGLGVSVICVLIFGLGWWIKGAGKPWLLIVGAVFALAALVVPWLLLPLNRIWTAVTGKIGLALNWVLLGIFYNVVLLPLGLLMRIGGKDPLALRRPRGTGDYWKPIERHQTAENLEDAF